MAKISIITPTYNREILVQNTIDSIRRQTYTDWELVVVDDGSTDNTEQVMQKYSSDPRIRYVKKQNSGQASSLNVGVSHVTSEFIVFLDSDDEAYENWLEVVNKELKEDIGILSIGAVRKLLDGTMVKELPYDFHLLGQKMKIKFTCGSFFIRRDLFNAIGGYDASLKAGIQTDLAFRLVAYLKDKSLKVISMDECLVQVNIHPGPRIRTNYEKVGQGGIQFLKKHSKLISKSEIANVCATIAFSSYKTNHRMRSVKYLIKAIRNNPRCLTNYARIVKYTLM